MREESFINDLLTRLALLLVLAALGMSSLASLDAGRPVLVSLHRLWWLAAPSGLTTTGMALERLAWDPVILALLQLPAVVVPLIAWLWLRRRALVMQQPSRRY